MRRVASSDLTAEEREAVLARDHQRCLACGRRPATLQHRRSKGMGGIGTKHPRLTTADGVALCLDHNVAADQNADFRGEALAFGWKILRTCSVPSDQIPYYDRIGGNWWLPDKRGSRQPLDEETALLLMAACAP